MLHTATAGFFIADTGFLIADFVLGKSWGLLNSHRAAQ